jgi:hypothetical protein
VASILVQFIFRLTFGVAVAMGVTPSRLVTSGFFRVHLWVLMGLNTFASLVIISDRGAFGSAGQVLLALAICCVVISYIGAAVWLYEKHRAGSAMLYAVALVSLLAAALATPWSSSATPLSILLGILDLVTGGMVLGSTLAAMLLGHWYLNTPTMELVPLKRLILLMAAAIILRGGLCAAGLLLQLGAGQSLETGFWIWLSLRWLSGLLGTIVLAKLAWETLKVPNTQSATGILYALVILAFIGELTAQLLSVDMLYPL